jgi:hypothetical protein
LSPFPSVRAIARFISFQVLAAVATGSGADFSAASDGVVPKSSRLLTPPAINRDRGEAIPQATCDSTRPLCDFDLIEMFATTIPTVESDVSDAGSAVDFYESFGRGDLGNGVNG